MKAMVRRLIDRYGMNMKVARGNGVENVQAFLQPVTSKSWQNMERMIPVGGELLRGQYLLIADADCGIEAADVIHCGERSYCVRRADHIYYCKKPLFFWGLCVEVGEDDPWFS